MTNIEAPAIPVRNHAGGAVDGDGLRWCRPASIRPGPPSVKRWLLTLRGRGRLPRMAGLAGPTRLLGLPQLILHPEPASVPR